MLGGSGFFAGAVAMDRLGEVGEDALMESGEAWAYRKRGIDPLVEVRVVREGTQKPARVLVRFVAEEFEGREEWVPPARLKVPWSGVEELRAREERWERVSALGPDRDDPQHFAASEIFDEYVDPELATINYRDGTSISITKPKALASWLGLELEQLTDYPEAFVEDGAVVAPWPATEIVARAVAEKHCEQILLKVAEEEKKARYEAIHGHYISTSRGREFFISGEESAEVDQRHSAPVRAILRQWCGAESVERFDELVELRKEIKRVGDVAQRAIDALRAHGLASPAAELERDLGTPVKMLCAD